MSLEETIESEMARIYEGQCPELCRLIRRAVHQGKLPSVIGAKVRALYGDRLTTQAVELIARHYLREQNTVN